MSILESKNSKIVLIEDALNELNSFLIEKDEKIVQLQQEKDKEIFDIQKEKNQLDDICSNKNYEIDSLNNENQKLKEQIEEMYQTQDTLKAELQNQMIVIKSVEEKVYDANETANKYILETKELKNVIIDLEGKVAKKEKDLEKLDFESTNLKKHVKSLRDLYIHQEQETRKQIYQPSRTSQILDDDYDSYSSFDSSRKYIDEKLGTKKTTQRATYTRQRDNIEQELKKDESTSNSSRVYDSLNNLTNSKRVQQKVQKKTEPAKPYQPSKSTMIENEISDELNDSIDYIISDSLSEEDLLKQRLGLLK
ncbi:MAG: hypothetical protein U9Q30_01225 [Campylobacterota bacterium]|nr:hypothetical protein [Campylobacterota bacterium]